MTIIIFSNAKGFQNNKYDMILVCQLGNITDYIYINFFIYEIIIQVTHIGHADNILCMPIQSLHHIVYIFTFYSISMSNHVEIMTATCIFSCFLYRQWNSNLKGKKRFRRRNSAQN